MSSNIKISDPIALIVKLNRDTKEGNITWAVSDLKPQLPPKQEYLIDNVYVATVLQRSLRVYKYRQQVYFEEDQFYWSDTFALEFIDYKGNVEWSVPGNSELGDLYQTIQYKTAEVEDFLNKYLGGNENDSSSNEKKGEGEAGW